MHPARNPRSRRPIAWLLAVAMFVATLVPLRPAALAGTGWPGGEHDVCFTDPGRIAGDDRSGDAQGPASHAGGHCALCVLHGAPDAPPPAVAAGLVLPRDGVAPPAADGSGLPGARLRWAAAPPRAPPLTS